jgi:polysaccharide export outer membrane protein
MDELQISVWSAVTCPRFLKCRLIGALQKSEIRMKSPSLSLTSNEATLKKMTIFKRVMGGCLLTVFLGYGTLSLRAQEQSANPSPQTSPANVAGGVAAVSTAPTTEQYRIGPRDVLSIRVTAGRLVPELSMDTVEVSECGQIPLPSVQQEEQNEIRAAGLTRTELAEQLRRFYTKYKRNPQVVVTIKEYNSQPVAINGAVVKPGQFQLRRPVRLLELLQFYAGGPTARAGGSIQIARLANFNPCEANPNAAATDAVSFQLLKLSDTLAGIEQANPYLQPGDVITLPDAKEAYIVGNVLRPGPVILKEDKITISQAIAMAGGTMPDTKQDKVRIIRQEPSGAKQEIFVDLKAIDRRQAPDIALLPNDIIDVPASSGKRLLRSILGTVTQLPVRIIP